MNLLLLLLMLVLPLAAIGERATKDDATITNTKTIVDGGNCLLKFSAIFLLASSIFFSCRILIRLRKHCPSNNNSAAG